MGRLRPGYISLTVMTKSQESATVGIKPLAVLLVHIYENAVVKLNKSLTLALGLYCRKSLNMKNVSEVVESIKRQMNSEPVK